MQTGVDNVVGFGKINLVVIVSYNLTLRLGLQTHLLNVSRLVVKQTVRITAPRYSSEKNHRFLHWVANHHFLARLKILSLLDKNLG